MSTGRPRRWAPRQWCDGSCRPRAAAGESGWRGDGRPARPGSAGPHPGRRGAEGVGEFRASRVERTDLARSSCRRDRRGRCVQNRSSPGVSLVSRSWRPAWNRHPIRPCRPRPRQAPPATLPPRAAMTSTMPAWPTNRAPGHRQCQSRPSGQSISTAINRCHGPLARPRGAPSSPRSVSACAFRFGPHRCVPGRRPSS